MLHSGHQMQLSFMEVNMCTSEQAFTDKQLRLQPKVMGPEERRRRLRKVYDILLVLAEQTEATAVDTPCSQPQPVN